MKELALALMLALIPPAKQSDGKKSAEARYETIATAIANNSDEDRTLLFFLLSIARHESSFRADIQTGATRGDGRRSWGIFQIMCGRSPNSVVPGTEYRAKEIVGLDLDAIDRAALATAYWVRKFVRRCRGNAMCVFKSYGGISQTSDPKVRARLRARVRTYHELRSRAAAK